MNLHPIYLTGGRYYQAICWGIPLKSFKKTMAHTGYCEKNSEY